MNEQSWGDSLHDYEDHMRGDSDEQDRLLNDCLRLQAQLDDKDKRIEALDSERATLTAQLDTLRAELAEAMEECTDFAISYGTGDEDRYKARYAELTGRELAR